MNDAFEALFGAPLDDDDDAPAAAVPDAPVVAEVSAVLHGGQHLVRLPDGRQEVIRQYTFDRLDAGARVVLYPDPAERWTLVDPAWELPPAVGTEEPLARGSRVTFTAERYDRDSDALVGRVDELPAFVERAHLQWPHTWSDIDLTPLVGTQHRLRLADPTSRPVRLATQIAEPAPSMPVPRLLALAALARRCPTVSVRYVGAWEYLSVELFGQWFSMFPEDLGWAHAPPALHVGQAIQAQLSVDMVGAGVFLGFRHPDDPEWTVVRGRYPVGARIERVELISVTLRGLVVRVADPDMAVYGIIPASQLSVAPQVWRSGDPAPVPLEVIEHRSERCVLVLGIAPHVALSWARTAPRVGEILPLRGVVVAAAPRAEAVTEDADAADIEATGEDLRASTNGEGRVGPTVIGLWGLNRIARLTTPAVGAVWGRVQEIDVARHHLEVEPLGGERPGFLERDTSNGPKVRFADGRRVPVDIADDDEVLAWDTRVHTRLSFVPMVAHEPPLSVTLLTGTARASAWAKLEAAHEAAAPITGRVLRRIKGGLEVELSDGGFVAFLPGSLVDTRPVKHLDGMVGSEVAVQVMKLSQASGKILVSRRAVVEAERARLRERTIPTIVEGAVLPGVVKNVNDYAAFVDLGGIDGMVHITQMSYRRLSHPSEMFQIGQAVQVRVLAFDQEYMRVTLSTRPEGDPWDGVEARLPVGTVVEARVVALPEYGAMVELADGVEGLVHISEMTWNKRVKSASKLVRVGDVVPVVVLSWDLENRRVQLSMRQLQPNPWEQIARAYPPGSVVRGPVRNIIDYGIFIALEEGVDALCHVHDMSWSQQARHPTLRFKKGDVVDALVLKVDVEGERVSVGIRQLTVDPWASVASRYRVGQVCCARALNRVDAGLFVELEDGVEGLIQGEEAKAHGDQDPVIVRIISIDAENRHILLAEERDEAPVAVPPAPATRPGSTTPSQPATRLAPEPGGLAEASAVADVPGMPGSARLPAPPRIDTPIPPGGAPVAAGKSLWVISAQFRLKKAELLPILATIAPGPPPEWTAVLPPDLEMRLLNVLSARTPAGRSAGETPTVPATSVTASPMLSERPATGPGPRPSASSPIVPGPPGKPPVASTVGSAPATPAAPLVPTVVIRRQVEPAAVTTTVKPPIAAGTGPRPEASSVGPLASPPVASGPVSSAPVAPERTAAAAGDARRRRADALRRFQGSRASALEPDSEDAGHPVDATTERASADLTRAWSEWAESERGASALADALDAHGLAAAASLVDGPRSPWDRLPAYRALDLLAQAQAAPPPIAVERILRVIAADPDDMLGWHALAAALPSLSRGAQLEGLERWCARHLDPSPRHGPALAAALASVTAGDLRAAHERVLEALALGECEDLRIERARIARAFEERILDTQDFFGRWRRRPDLPFATGGFSVVLPVTDIRTGALHALKIARLLDVPADQQRTALQLFGREARLLQQASGRPGLPAFVAQPAEDALACAWVHGQPLSELLPSITGDPPWSVTAASALGARIAGALHSLSELHPRFAHNDVAPRNILVPPDRPQEAVLIDLGLAGHAYASVTSLLDDLQLRLREAWHAPEVRRGEPGTPQSDMYALGLILFALVTGRGWPELTPDQGVERRALAKLRGLGEVLGRLLEPAPNRRPRAWAEIEADLVRSAQ